MAGSFRSANDTVSAKHAVAATANDAIIPVTRALYIGTGGTLVVRMADSQLACTFNNVPAGIFPIQVDVIYSTSTVSNIVALY